MIIRVEVMPAASLLQLQSVWDALHVGRARLPILDAKFFQLLLEHFASGTERLIVGRAPDGRVCATGLVRQVGMLTWETFQPSQAPLAGWLFEPSVGAAHWAQSALRALSPLCVQLGVTQQDPQVNQIEARPGLRVVPYIDVAKLELQDDFETYWSRRGKNLRQNLKKQRNKIERDGLEIRVNVCSRRSEMQGAVQRYCDLESAGWKAKEGTSLVWGGVQARFYLEMLQQYAEDGEARVFELEIANRVVASDLCLSRGGTLIILKTTHDETMHPLSPSMLLKQEIIRHGYETNDYQLIEFYGKAMEWHRRLTDDVRPIYHVNAYRNELAARLTDCVIRLKRRVGRDSSEPSEPSTGCPP